MTVSGVRNAGAHDIDFTTAEFPTLYAQQVVVGSSPYDFSLVFIEHSIRGSLPVASVTLPPAVAKQLSAKLRATIARYEETFGKITIPSALHGDHDPGEGGIS